MLALSEEPDLEADLAQFEAQQQALATKQQSFSAMRYAQLPIVKEGGASFVQPIVPGAPRWATGKNMLIGGGIALAAYLAYAFLKPPKKPAAPVSGRGLRGPRVNIADTKKALLTAQRAYERAMRARSCGEAANNLRLGQKWEQRGREGVRENLPTKLEYKYWSPERRELFELQQMLPNAEMNAHQHRLDKCGITQMQHEQRAAADRVDKTDASRERQYRKRRKVRR